jgi:hypothetical protein
MKKVLQLLLMALCVILVMTSCEGSYYVTDQPNEPVYVQPASPGAGYVWIDGEWGWSGGRYIYTHGYWSRPRAGYHWQRGRWGHTAHGYHWNRGGWRR